MVHPLDVENVGRAGLAEREGDAPALAVGAVEPERVRRRGAVTVVAVTTDGPTGRAVHTSPRCHAVIGGGGFDAGGLFEEVSDSPVRVQT
ncbi:uncharacterized protein HHUB_3409 [Halobacterium hubeiense]|uniref:Uncharacterized protein n=1 Tax=Halobacterium hubeiense TaxID=1407499 RepID=A0A0U5H5V1_9EURY|nr:uncharacterized protein HHUB_3409 [Halobacterium hubeiense]